MERQNENLKSHFHLAFLIASDEQPVHTIKLESSSKIPKPTLRHHLPDCWRSQGRGELNWQFNSNSNPPCAYVMHIFSNFTDCGSAWLQSCFVVETTVGAKDSAIGKGKSCSLQTTCMDKVLWECYIMFSWAKHCSWSLVPHSMTVRLKCISFPCTIIRRGAFWIRILLLLLLPGWFLQLQTIGHLLLLPGWSLQWKELHQWKIMMSFQIPTHLLLVVCFSFMYMLPTSMVIQDTTTIININMLVTNIFQTSPGIQMERS